MQQAVYGLEWQDTARLFLGFPSDEALWGEDLEPARREVAALAAALSAPRSMLEGKRARPTPISLVVADEKARLAAASLLAPAAQDPFLEIVILPFGDIWLRDTGPIFRGTSAGASEALRFAFNGWGGKYQLPGDGDIGRLLAQHIGAHIVSQPFILEGGAVELDGEGTILTTKQCLLNVNRNSDWSKAAAEAALASAFTTPTVLWLDEGLANDHTDGHIDNIARFLAPGLVACQRPFGADDPNAAVFRAIEADLRRCRDAKGRALDIVTLPSPGAVHDEDDEIVPASHLNFLRANGRIIVPDYGATSIEEACAILAQACPGEEVIALPSRFILTGGGSFHCLSQPVPTIEL